MLRYMRRLADRDLALDRSMIPLGSCTMKLNATAEMIPVTWPEFGRIHPFAPAEPGRRLSRTVRASSNAGCAKITGYRRRLAAAQLRRAGRIRGLLGDPRLSRSRGEGASQRLPHPSVRARHQSRHRPPWPA